MALLELKNLRTLRLDLLFGETPVAGLAFLTPPTFMVKETAALIDILEQQATIIYTQLPWLANVALALNDLTIESRGFYWVTFKQDTTKRGRSPNVLRDPKSETYEYVFCIAHILRPDEIAG